MSGDELTLEQIATLRESVSDITSPDHKRTIVASALLSDMMVPCAATEEMREAGARVLCGKDIKNRYITTEQRQVLIDKNWRALLSRFDGVWTAALASVPVAGRVTSKFYYRLHVGDGWYESNSLPHLLITILRHRLSHLWQGEGWRD